jgi:hypothetical protein
MTITDMHIMINLGLQKIASNQVDSFLPQELDLELNKNIQRFIEHRLNKFGNKYRTGFEGSQKRIDDLRTLVTEHSDNTVYKGQISNTHHIDTYTLPVAGLFTEEYLHLINVRCLVSYNKCKPIITTFEPDGGGFLSYRVIGEAGVDSSSLPIVINNEHTNTMSVAKYVQLDDIYTILDDPFNNTSYKNPIYTMIDDKIDIYTDNKFVVSTVKITYIRIPNTVDSVSATTVDCDLPDHTHQEIVDMTVNSLLEAISDPRYRTNLGEVQRSE